VKFKSAHAAGRVFEGRASQKAAMTIPTLVHAARHVMAAPLAPGSMQIVKIAALASKTAAMQPTRVRLTFVVGRSIP